jgi:hypothetical protein
MSLWMLYSPDIYPIEFVYRVASTLRDGKRAADLVWYERERRAAMRLLLLEEADILCCGNCCAEQRYCICCGRETSEAVQSCPRPVLLTPDLVANLHALDTACGLAWMNSLMGRKSPRTSYPSAPSYVCLV